MTLADFINSQTDRILQEWEEFARSIWPMAGASPEELRDHAAELLLAIANDMRSSQSLLEQAEKSKGRGTEGTAGQALSSASRSHSRQRVQSGLELALIVAEYRALRASVVHLWTKDLKRMEPDQIKQLTRFNEAIDQMVAYSITEFNAVVENTRETLLGIVSHDLRVPLNAIGLSADLLQAKYTEDSEESALVDQIATSSKAMEGMVHDLLDFAQTRLGRPLSVQPAPCALGALIWEVAAEVRASDPSCTIRTEIQPGLRATVDPGRMRQLVSNLLKNAVVHGDPSRPVRLVAEAGRELVIEVHNEGPPIPSHLLPRIFEPMVQGNQSGARCRPQGSMGLGLNIACQIARAHGGDIEVSSSAEAGTTFTVRIPAPSTSHP